MSLSLQGVNSESRLKLGMVRATTAGVRRHSMVPNTVKGTWWLWLPSPVLAPGTSEENGH